MRLWLTPSRSLSTFYLSIQAVISLAYTVGIRHRSLWVIFTYRKLCSSCDACKLLTDVFLLRWRSICLDELHPLVKVALLFRNIWEVASHDKNALKYEKGLSAIYFAHIHRILFRFYDLSSLGFKYIFKLFCYLYTYIYSDSSSIWHCLNSNNPVRFVIRTG